MFNVCSKTAITFMIQFFVDLAGFQEYDIREKYEANGINAKEVISDMENIENMPSVVKVKLLKLNFFYHQLCVINRLRLK